MINKINFLFVTLFGIGKLKMIPCAACGAPMPELRKINYGYSVCVNCSKVGAYKGVYTYFISISVDLIGYICRNRITIYNNINF